MKTDSLAPTFEMRTASASEIEPTERSRALRRYWLGFAILVLAIILSAVICWSLAHPFGIHWDESEYLDEILIDTQRLRHLMLHKLGGRILLGSWGRPPAYRLVADPILAIFGTATTTARLISLACFSLSAWFIFLSSRLLSNRIAGAFAALIFCLSPEVIAASSFFGTDTTLYLATSAMLYFLLVGLRDPGEHSLRAWVGLGFAVGLGFLSKTSFLLIGPPAILTWFVVRARQGRNKQDFVFLLKAGFLAFLLAGPWWVLNFKGAVEYARYAHGFVRNSLGPPSLLTWAKWLNTVAQCLLGHGVTIVTVLVVGGYLVARVGHPEKFLTPLQRSAFWLCACTGLPIVATQIIGTNHLLRHISPAVIPLAIVIGVLAAYTLWTSRAWAAAVVSGAFLAQLCMIVYPVIFPNSQLVEIGFVNGALPWRTLARFDQWNWQPLLDLSKACNVPAPKIAYLGGGREFNPAAIEYPWAADARNKYLLIPYPDVNWLWRYEDGAPDWQKIMSTVADSDFVITAPNYVGEVTLKENEDNQYNAELAGRLSKDPGFEKPVAFRVGRFDPIEIMVFPRRGLACNPSAQPL